MKRVFLSGVAALFLATGTAHAQSLDKMFAEDARRERALARCNMELMKYEAMKPREVMEEQMEPKARGQLPFYSLQKSFFKHCMGAEGYSYDYKHRMPKPLDNDTCGDRWEKRNDMDFPDCWKRDPRS